MLTRWRAAWSALPREGRDTLFLLAVVGWLLVPHLERLPLWTSALAAVVLVWRARLAWGSRPLPAWPWRLGLLLLALAGTLWTHRTVVGRDAGVTLCVVLLALKTLELRARRDAFVLFFLGFFAMLTNFFWSQSLPVAAAILVGLLGLLTALVLAHMPIGKPPLALAARYALRMAAWGTPVMVALFLLFPRVAPLWGTPSDQAAGTSGLSPNMQIGNVAELALDDGIAMRIRWLTPGNLPPPQSQLYFRGPVLGAFDGREWKPLGANFGGGETGFAARWQTAAALQVAGEPIRYEATLDPHRRPWLLLLDAAGAPPALPEGWSAAMLPDLQWLANRPVNDLLRFTAESYPDFRHGPTERSTRLAAYTQLPEGFDPRTRALAAELRAAAAGSTEALVGAALQRLRTGGYAYTLEPGVYGRDTADAFWFDRKAGFCEHIASAFVVLLRAADVPARIVTGYQGGERNSVDGFWTIRQADAHAWAEVWLAGRGWVRVDPTGAVAPGRTGAFGRLAAPRGALGTAVDTVISPGVAARVRAAWEAVNNRWNQWVLNYSQSRQLDLLKHLGFTSPSWEDLGLVLAGLLALGAAAGAGFTLVERRRQDPWLALLHAAQRRLARAGLAAADPLRSDVPPRTLAAAVRASGWAAPQADSIAAWLLQLDALRYARAPQHDIAALRRAFARLPWPPRTATS